MSKAALSLRSRHQTSAWFQADRWSEYLQTPDGWLCAGGARIAPYEHVDADLISPFAAILVGAQRLEDAVPRLRTFYQDFGLLGYTLLTGRPHRVPRAAGRFDLREGDPIHWALAHAENVALILALTRERYKQLDRRLTSISETQSLMRIPTIAPPQNSVPLALDVAQELEKPGIQPLDVARRIIAELLNSNLAGIARVYDPQTAAPRFHFRALIDIIFWQLADRLEGRYQIRVCPCGALFFAQDARQKHCPPRTDARESACTKRFRMRRLRRRR